jgi:tetratricopeptide (TPR) repeat protein
VYGLATTIPHESGLQALARATTLPQETAALLSVVERRPYFVEARIEAISLLLTQRRAGEANALFNAGLALPSHRRLLQRRLVDFMIAANYERSRQEYSSGHWEASIDASRQILALSHDPALLADAHNQIAWILVDSLGTRLDEAERHSLESLRLRPKTPAFLDTLAWIRYKQGRLKEALSIQSDALRRNGNPGTTDQTGEMSYHLGAVYEKLGRTGDAVRAYRAALAIRPSYPQVEEALRRIYPSGQPAENAPALPSPRADPAVQRGVL